VVNETIFISGESSGFLIGFLMHIRRRGYWSLRVEDLSQMHVWRLKIME
jgi:hypothetical protein